ncbi:MAG: hypothetical protein JWP97_4659 [Labilithrix sp.]|nr:hypothetical protein [Labilithrix sp.]
MSLFSGTVPQTLKTLKSMEAWLTKAEAHAAARKFDANTLLQARLAPDQLPLVRQFQIACDTAKFLASRVSGKEAPKNADTEVTFADVRARIAATIAYLEGFTDADFATSKDRIVPLTFMPGKGLTAANYANEFAMPNFYFHAVTAYAILRHNGVELGKSDYYSSMSLVDV